MASPCTKKSSPRSRSETNTPSAIRSSTTLVIAALRRMELRWAMRKGRANSPSRNGQNEQHHEADGARVVQRPEPDPLLRGEQCPPAGRPAQVDEQQDGHVRDEPSVVGRAQAGPLLVPVGVAERPPTEHQGHGQAGQELEETLHGVLPSTLPPPGISMASPASTRAGPVRNSRSTAASPAQARRSASARSIQRSAPVGACRSVAATAYSPSSSSVRARPAGDRPVAAAQGSHVELQPGAEGHHLRGTSGPLELEAPLGVGEERHHPTAHHLEHEGRQGRDRRAVRHLDEHVGPPVDEARRGRARATRGTRPRRARSPPPARASAARRPRPARARSATSRSTHTSTGAYPVRACGLTATVETPTATSARAIASASSGVRAPSSTPGSR